MSTLGWTSNIEQETLQNDTFRTVLFTGSQVQLTVMSLAAGTQLFVEPRVLSQASKGVVPPDYSINQLAYLYAFRQGDFNGSAAISLLLLLVAAALSAIFVFRGGLFERD